METNYYDITNSHPSTNVTVTVEASALALTSGSHSCQLNLGSSTVDLTYEAVEVTDPVRVTFLKLGLHLVSTSFLVAYDS